MQGRWGLERLGARNAGRERARSVLTAGLLASATFVIVTVAAMRTGAPTDTLDPASGAGGFNLILETDIPLQYDLRLTRSREALAVGDIPDSVAFVSLKSSEGEDISCLNLYRPQQPRILGVPDDLIERGAFSFAASQGHAANPWTLLRGSTEIPSDTASPDGIPVIADAETAEWILHLGLGDSLTVSDESGAEQRLRLVALLKTGLFQGELLMGRSAFDRLFPSRSGFSTVLIRADPAEGVDPAAVRGALEGDLEDFGALVDRTADQLALFSAVANTYLATFRAIGGFGLLLGTVGLGVVLLRGLFERRGELALLAALGFSRRAVARLVLAENALLLLAGLASGTAAALVAVAPQVASGASEANWPLVAGTLAAILAAGLAVLAGAIRIGLRSVGVADLRAE